VAAFYVLDTRQYRSDQACGDGTKADCAARLDPARTMLGPGQEAWLAEQARWSDARWDVLAQQVFFANFDRTEGPGESYAMDKWSGYVPSRDRMIDLFAAPRRNLVILTGDEHAHYASNVRRDWRNPESPIVGCELVGTSITSGGDGADRTVNADVLLRENPHILYNSSRRGYVSCTVTPDRWDAHFRIVPYVTRPGAPLETGQSFVIEAGRPGLMRA
jgi:alkaline phosphatase D